MAMTQYTPPLWLLYIASLISGSLTTYSLAPYQLWPLAVLSVTGLCLGITYRPHQTTSLAFSYGLGLFGTGVSWVYGSIANFGNASPWLAGLLTLLFVVILATLFILPFLCQRLLITLIKKYKPTDASLHTTGRTYYWVWLLPILLIIGEHSRSWLFTGFPWLYLGYSQLDTPLAGWAPIGGVYASSLAVAMSGCLLAGLLLAASAKQRIINTIVIAGLWLSGWVLQHAEWTTPKGDPIHVATVQPNIAQDKKWQPHYLPTTLKRFEQLSEPLWHSHDWIVWPEAAIPLLYHRAEPLLETFHQRAITSNTALISGLLYDNPHDGNYYNSVMGFGRAMGMYEKQRLVPFGEYVPLEEILRGMIEFFNLPTSFISAGNTPQRGLQIGGVMLMPAICYEIAYPDLVAQQATHADVLLTVSNDAWFGRSIGPLQHAQIAQFRALETGRFLIRATNNGISAIITPNGTIQQHIPQFIAGHVSGRVYAYTGTTPFSRWGSMPLLWSLLLGWGIIGSYLYLSNHRR